MGVLLLWDLLVLGYAVVMRDPLSAAIMSVLILILSAAMLWAA